MKLFSIYTNIIREIYYIFKKKDYVHRVQYLIAYAYPQNIL